jgi:signal transduction histidine kinase
MMRRMAWPQFNHAQILRYAGLFTYACVGIPLLRYQTLVDEQLLKQRPGYYVDLWLACYFLFGLVFWFLTHNLGARRPTWLERFGQIVLLLVLNATAIVIGWISQSGLCALLLVVVALVLPWLLPLRASAVWMVLQNFSLIPVFMSQQAVAYTVVDGTLQATLEPVNSFTDAFLQSSLYIGIGAAVFVAAVVAKQQAEAREDQRRLNSELRATRTLLAESSRLAERMRISRELHDLIGHHLTALSLNLEVASHLVSGQAQDHVRQAQSVAKLLLGDVREVVSQLRDEDSIDLTQALGSLVEGVPGLAIHLELPPRFSVDDPKRAQVLLRCAQEIITNTVRHAGARNLWLRFERNGEKQMVIHARDDGRGAAELKPGNGLAGMRERLAQYGGRLDIVTAKDRGFALDAWLPLEGAA